MSTPPVIQAPVSRLISREQVLRETYGGPYRKVGTAIGYTPTFNEGFWDDTKIWYDQFVWKDEE